MAGHRYRTNKIKRMHSIIHGLLPILEAMARHPAITQITPGRISANRRANDSYITLQYYTDSGMKLLARNPSTIQEVFIVTSEPEEVHHWMLAEGLIDAAKNSVAPAKEQLTDSGRDSNSGKEQVLLLNNGQARGISKNVTKQAEPFTRRKAIGRVPEVMKAAVAQPSKKDAGRKKQPDLGLYADYLTDPDAPINADAPTDAVLLADHLQNGTATKLRQLRDQVVAAEQAKKERQAAKPLSNSTQKPGQKTTVKPAQGAAPKPATQPARKPAQKVSNKQPQPGKELNPLEAWLAQADDDTIRRLSNKYKGGNH